MKNRSRKSIEIQHRIRKLRLTARRLLHTFGEGSFRTTFHGRGIEFASLREYVPGDDIRQIEWKTTARRGSPYVKTFIEERDLSVFLAVDRSSSMEMKSEAVLELVSLITALADYHDDRIGCLGFTDQVEFYVPPRKSPTQAERILHLLLSPEKSSKKTSIQQALLFLQRVLRKHSILFFISDFLDRNFEQSLMSLARKHEIVGIYVYDPVEKHLPERTVMECYEPETKRRELLDGYDHRTRAAYQAFAKQQDQLVSRTFSRSRSDLLTLPATSHAGLRLIEFLRLRQNSKGLLQIEA